MFDARPLSMTKAGKIQNYLGKEPDPWIGKNGVKALATSLIKPLAPFRDRFSVLNGVCMAPSFDGHLQNMNFLFAGKPFGGDSFIPHLNSAETGRKPESLDAIVPDRAAVHQRRQPFRRGAAARRHRSRRCRRRCAASSRRARTHGLVDFMRAPADGAIPATADASRPAPA